jgi:hypothetical protein
MKTLLNPKAIARRGMTYATVIVSMIVVGTVLAAFLKLVAVQNQATARSQTWNRSVPVLEAGIEEAMAHLNKNGSPDSGGLVDLNRMKNNDGWYAVNDALTGPWYKFGWMNGDFYYVSISSWNGSVSNFPTINSTGWVRHFPAFALNQTRGPLLAQSEFGSYTRRLVQCGTTNNPTFSKALVAKNGIDLNGNNVMVDSYDSSIPAYNTNGRWDINKRRANGDVASNDTVTNSINVGNANIYGRVATGPLGTVSVGPNGAVGDLAWHSAGNRGIKPGYSTDDMNVEFPDVVMPAGSDAWVPPPSSWNLPSGDYRLASGSINTKVVITSNSTVRLRVDGGFRFTGQNGIEIQQGAKLIIYLNCPSADITGQGIVNSTGTPGQCYIFGTPALTSLDIGGNGECTAVVYAPNAAVTMHGAGTSPMDFSGAVMGKTFKFSGHYKLHYDEALGRNGLWRGFTIISWNEK